MSLRRRLEADGYASAGRVLDAGQLDAARAAADRLLAERGAASEYAVIALESYRHEPLFRALLEPLGALACEALAVRTVVAFQDLVIDKPPRATARELPWHQDQTYLPLDRADGVVAWLALDDVDAERGCLRYVPGSHRLGPRRPGEFGAGIAGDDETLAPMEPDAHPHALAESRAGDAWLHHPFTWHASPPNRTDGHRRAWSVWFVREGTRWAPDRAPHPYLLELTPAAGSPLDPGRFPRVGCATVPA